MTPQFTPDLVVASNINSLPFLIPIASKYKNVWLRKDLSAVHYFLSGVDPSLYAIRSGFSVSGNVRHCHARGIRGQFLIHFPGNRKAPFGINWGTHFNTLLGRDTIAIKRDHETNVTIETYPHFFPCDLLLLRKCRYNNIYKKEMANSHILLLL